LVSGVGTWEPYAGIRAGHYTQQGYSENGGGVVALNYTGGNSNMVSSVMGMRFLATDGSLFNRPLSWMADLSWEHRLTGTTPSLTAAFAVAPTQTYQVFGAPAERNAAKLTLGVNWQPTPSTKVFLNLGAEEGSASHSYGVQLGAQWKW